ncbi:MAG: hypothetical protein HC906_19345 [Bacteroidales bacterium]|nr:hypothetical protein [Bacteroidales bacterium]
MSDRELYTEQTDAMDRIIVDKRWLKPKHLKFIIPGIFILAVVLYAFLHENTSTYRTEAEK